MTKCQGCPYSSDDCPDRADGALLALGPFWGGGDRDCPRELKEWRKEWERRAGEGEG